MTRVSGVAGTVIEGTAGTLTVVATLRLFARAREIAGTGSDTVRGSTVDEVIAEVAAARQTERGTRADDKRSETAMEDRKKEGYF